MDDRKGNPTKSQKRRREETKANEPTPRKVARPSAPTPGSSEAVPKPRDSARGRTYNRESKEDWDGAFMEDNYAVHQKYKAGNREDYTGDPTWVFILTGMRPQLFPVAQVPEVFELREAVTKLEKDLQTKEKEWQELFDHHVQTAKNWPKE